MLRKLFLLPVMAAVLSACVSAPTNLNLSLDRHTEHEKYRVAIHPLTEPAINKMHQWELEVRTARGEPVTGARIDVAGGMPQHGHGFPTQPRVTKELGNGHYLLEGMKFSMPGWWEIKLNVNAASGNDAITFNTIIAL
jgi:hypothetical protein